jgi:hypothetical protein
MISKLTTDRIEPSEFLGFRVLVDFGIGGVTPKNQLSHPWLKRKLRVDVTDRFHG